MELRCWLCRGTFEGTGKQEKKANRVCGNPRCQSVRWVIYGILHRLRTEARNEGRCRYCAEPPLPDSKYCGRHAFRREPCPGQCGGNRVRRNEGQGNHPRFCDACRKRPKPRSSAPREQEFTASIEMYRELDRSAP